VVGKLKPGVPRERIDEALAAIVALNPPGCLAVHVGVDAGLRAANWSFAITSDFADAEFYHRYDADPEHNRVRADLFAPICEDTVRVQFLLD
jgi:hypothetical protein